jgi:tRNA 2-thiouridine synthesizing protein A
MSFDAEWDAGTMGCGELIVLLRERMLSLSPGQVLRLLAHDPGAAEDIPAWCGMTRHPLRHAAHPVYLIERRP